MIDELRKMNALIELLKTANIKRIKVRRVHRRTHFTVPVRVTV